jgi:hypothetical protein
MEKCYTGCGDFLHFSELSFNGKYDMAWGDVACNLNFQNYLSIEKFDVT